MGGTVGIVLVGLVVRAIEIGAVIYFFYLLHRIVKLLEKISNRQ
ncbi:Hypothetical protein ADU72_0809 [Pediococcus damnosus]|uniref:Uncharacterized protein n=1 Tax=Pediococcus damnosus TaxID=51663 RepID=A0AAC9FJC2_9LACO|nr:hypothetical protein [Pediococcus damnosus]AMV60754.1 Hypothetical protein ADU69_1093 [Pediococcus damnosus]AMV63345.1 Hypothetical protein ADU70_1879 [Pediococcus damnosus]AMV65066.1 Hypothetical protein ADU71_1168 [Pediococcus damnosus]AMV66754.1 Hypothetical protein ADU72_0809 [Pediococcus damnosus]AMV69881.1 Hypothetical protein ADU73_1489 [Pediococcus damnosus]